MKKEFLSVAVLSSFFCTLHAAQVVSVTASQQWPWSTDIKVKYVLQDVTGPVDLQVSAMNGDKALSVPRKAIRGSVYGVETEEGSFYIDPAAAFGTDRTALAELKIKIEVSDSPGNLGEALYRIYDLNDGSCTDVTRKDLLNGKWGAVETEYSAIDPDFSTSLPDVLIWTDVTNNPVYKTDKLVMRKVHAKDQVWESGDPDGAKYNQGSLTPRYWVKLTYDYYISVFEMTKAQYRKVMGSVPDGCLGETDECPVNNIYYYHIHGHPQVSKGVNTGEVVCFPTNSYVRDVEKSSTFSAKIQAKTGVEFTLPTIAEWEFACRGGNDEVLYSGEAQTLEHVKKLAWTREDSIDAPAVVGKKLANAYGLYDMLGNVFERVLGSGLLNQGGISGSGESEDDPVVNPLGNLDTVYSTNPYSCGGASSSVQGGYWENCRHAFRIGGWYEWWAQRDYIGFRMVCPVTPTWGQGWPKTILSE